MPPKRLSLRLLAEAAFAAPVAYGQPARLPAEQVFLQLR